ncbi:hypothetical protein BDQ94DRAFT_155495 [Aspergillus welwitschiae]|uniref:Uncharacterized protein n=1 Tax=Aspergillus welwitschiae TaxID=1341132 RepID=A0A3F3PHZ6_9EURO|nr:hypothetical protein BDQ94DRAFT_155642 [Aspergillus welwitschiae]XP_026619494.1 hypothetical protein BDQ94DRAFT_155495 [Aspergillus welwitschiae]RDH26383.1 hypothetical protein BDQ94DRAFT_155642 [Aspergillus welwitschiae]RDH26472.1 hypothetical protein BDQ94DRAFT_155495 [Aspergillus welwitschiae]
MNPTHAVSSILPPEAILERLLPGHDFLVRLHFSYSHFETNKHPAPSASAYKTRLECI